MKKYWPDLAFGLSAAAFIAALLGIRLLDSPNWPTGGDGASHLLYAWLYSRELLFSGQILPWVPEVFCGFPFLSYYFPMPFFSIALLSKLIGVAPAFKWGEILAILLLPGAVFSASRRRFSTLPALFAALGALAFLLHEQNAIWGGNLLSTLAGEFAYSYGLFFAVLAMMAWARAASTGKWVAAAVLEAACGFSHGFTLLVVGCSTVFLLFEYPPAKTLPMLIKGHLLAFCLLGGWLWPMMEMHRLTIPNDASFGVSGWRDLLPSTLWPVLAAGLAGLASLAFPRARQAWRPDQAKLARYFASGAGLSAVLFIVGDQLGLADIRFFPPVWLFGAILCGWLFGQGLVSLPIPSASKLLFALSACAALFGWFGREVQKAPDWALWNNSGLDAKPQWHALSRLFPLMSGDPWGPRLVFEHDPDNADIGSTRSLEALPMFINHRPVLEGLYMESALTGPAIYQLQSEVSEHPSSPLVRFPSGSLDPQFAARHMAFLHADTLLLRSDKAKQAIEASGLFRKIAQSPPFSLYRLKTFDSRLVEVVDKPLERSPEKGWMQDAYDWFRSRSRFESSQPVYGMATPPPETGGLYPPVETVSLSRNEMVFRTEAVGRPHLVKFSYHPRWHLESRGELYLAAPGFMLVVPHEKEIRLVYGHTRIGLIGIAATVSALLFLVFRRREAPVEISGRNRMPVAWVLLAAAGIHFGLHSPERIYNLAWDEMHANHYLRASRLFEEAYRLRKPPAKKEEALFWWAKSSEMSGNRRQAILSYRKLCETYRGYWVPESLYTLSKLEKIEDTGRYRMRLLLEYPNNPWTLQLEQATP